MRKLAAVLAIATLSVGWATVAQAQDARLKKGDVIVATKNVPGVDEPKLVAKGVIKAPMDKVWALIEKCNDYKKTMLSLKSAKELKRKGNKVTCETVIDLPWPLSNLRSVTVATHVAMPGITYSRTWTMVEGDYEFNNGSWVLKPFGDGHTLATYTVHAKPHTAIPDSLRNSAQTRLVPDLYAHLRKQLEK